MKTLFIALLFVSLTASVSAQVYVDDYYRSDGTYVESHERTEPDGIQENNYSYTSPQRTGSSSSSSSSSSSYSTYQGYGGGVDVHSEGSFGYQSR